MSSKRGVSTYFFYYVVGFFVIMLSLTFIFQLLKIQILESDKYQAQEKRKVKKFIDKPSIRGNIFDAKNRLLVGNDITYSVYFDPLSPTKKIFDAKIDSLCSGLEKIIPSNTESWKAKFTNARKQKKRYVLLNRKINAEDFEKIKRLPIFRRGKYQGGLIYNEKNTRNYVFGDLAKRTLGNLNGVGLEGYFDSELQGVNGLQYSEKIGPNLWRPIYSFDNIKPQNGQDLYSTIDLDMQNIIDKKLKERLYDLQAEAGTAILMEVKTGKIRAMSNLSKIGDGEYREYKNYAVWEKMEPGSTFKLFSLMIALEDGKVDTNTIVNTYKGVRKIHNIEIRDTKKGGHGKITLKRAFEVSSNVGIGGLIYDLYHDNPEYFVDQLYEIGLFSKTNIEVIGEPNPVIPNPKDASWSGISLPWMAWGYGGVNLTPLQILTIYNGIANNGVVMKPTLIEKLVAPDGDETEFDPTVINRRLCSFSNVKKLKDMMIGVVKNGTAATLNKKNFQFAGKTGTTQLNYWNDRRGLDYIASFVGYFPAQEPKYSSIVVIYKPKASISYYGADCAGPIFYKIAENINIFERIDGNNESRDYIYSDDSEKIIRPKDHESL